MQQDHPTEAPIALSSIPAPRQRRRKGTVSAQAKGNAAIYLRVSTEEQAEDGNSLESQHARCHALCEARGLTVVDNYLDAGYSGGTLERPDLSAMREAVKLGTIGVVVVYAVDRLSRSQRDTLAVGIIVWPDPAGVGASRLTHRTGARGAASRQRTQPAGRPLLVDVRCPVASKGKARTASGGRPRARHS
jgi:Resolvase, N terminal domain